MSNIEMNVMNCFVSRGSRFVSDAVIFNLNTINIQEKLTHLSKSLEMRNWQRNIFWILLTALIFAFFRWLFGIAIPELAPAFSIGITVILVSALIIGRSVTLLWLKTSSPRNLGGAMILLSIFIVVSFFGIAFLLNAMIERTTLFPFAVTCLFIFLATTATGALTTTLRHQYKVKVMSAQAAVAQSKSELQLLQSQLSPHFLFNTLNNLYGLSLIEPVKVPPLLLKLSELLRYSVYDVKEIFVPLQDEVDYIRNYIDFERLRLGGRLSLHVDIEHQFDPKWIIPPMLLVVFVENAFKHARHVSGEQVTIDLRLHRKENYIVFSLRNSVASPSPDGHVSGKHSGFGLDSVRKRLNLLYFGRHQLEIKKLEKDFVVELTLPCE
jgi:sensor histidine kinase YesM